METTAEFGMCAQCGHTPTLHARFCPRCGKRLPDAPRTGQDSLPAEGAVSVQAQEPVPTPGRTVRRSTLGTAAVGADNPGTDTPGTTAAGVETPGAAHSVPQPAAAPTPAAAPMPRMAPEPQVGPSAGNAQPTGGIPTLPGLEGVPPASLGTRLAALLIDSALLSAVMGAGYMVFLVVAVLLALTGSSALSMLGTVLFYIFALAAMAFGLAYYILGIGRIGQTIGKRTLGLQVIDTSTHDVIGPGRAAARYFGLMLMGLPCYLGYITFFTDSSGWNRAWHDQIAHSVVIPVPGVPFGQACRDLVQVLKSR